MSSYDERDLGMYTVRRCTGCGTNWAVNDQFGTCARCGYPTERVNVNRHDPDERAPSYGESLQLAREIAAEEAAEAQRARDFEAKRADLEATRLERTLRAATAALNYDLDRWLTDGADWIAEESG